MVIEPDLEALLLTMPKELHAREGKAEEWSDICNVVLATEERDCSRLIVVLYEMVAVLVVVLAH
jgi:hypothetical protein